MSKIIYLLITTSLYKIALVLKLDIIPSIFLSVLITYTLKSIFLTLFIQILLILILLTISKLNYLIFKKHLESVNILGIYYNKEMNS